MLMSSRTAYMFSHASSSGRFDAPAVRPAPRETDGKQELPPLLEAPSPDATGSALTPT